jgi:protein SCO1/2
MSARNKLFLYLGLFLLILLGFWYFLFRGTDNWKTKLPVIGYVQPFAFLNQSGDTVTKESLSGKIYVANYFFVTCRGICPNMNGNMKKLYLEFKDDPDVLFVSHTCQPEVDGMADLKRYSDSIGSDGKKWQFLTGNKLDLYAIARESYHIDDPKNNVGDINDQFLHSQFLALVDQRGQLRGVYDGLKSKEINQLKEDIAGLEKEGPGTRFVNGIFGNSPTP